MLKLMEKSFTTQTVVVSLLLAFISFSARGENAPGVSENEIKIGSDTSLTGPYAVYGLVSKAADAYFKMINDSGGVFGRKINYSYKDNQSNPAKALEVMKELVQQDQIFASVLNLSAAHDGAMDFLQQKEVPDLLAGNGSAKLINYKFGTASTPGWADEATWMSKYVQKHFPKKKIGLLALNESGIETIEASISKAYEGKTPSPMIEKVDVAAVSLEAQILKLKNEKVEVILTTMDLGHTVAAIKTAHLQGYRPVFVSASYHAVSFAFALLGEDAEGLISSTYLKLPDDKHPSAEYKAHIAMVHKYYPDVQTNLLTVWGASQAEIFVEALKRTGKDLTRQKLMETIEGMANFKCTNCIDKLSLSKTQHRVYSSVHVVKATKGNWVMTGEKFSF